MIPLSIPNLSEVEEKSVARALASGWVSTAGPDIADFEKQLAERCGVRFAIALNSGTSALHLALLSLDCGPNDFIICPNLSFVATANAISYTGAEPIFIDTAPDNLQMDLDLLAEFLDQQTEFKNGVSYFKGTDREIKAILPVHILADSCDMDRLLELARAKGIPVVEDAAAALGATYKERPLGSMGLLGTLSFNGNKIITTGGGGAVLTNDPRLADHVRHLAQQAKSFPIEYIHDAIGFNYGMPNLSAALGLAQLSRLDAFLERKRAIRSAYENAFASIDTLSIAPIGGDVHAPGFWLNAVFTPLSRQLEAFLEANDIQTRKLWVPMNRLPMYGKALYYHQNDHSHRWYEESLCLPSSTSLTEEEQNSVITAVASFF